MKEFRTMPAGQRRAGVGGGGGGGGGRAPPPRRRTPSLPALSASLLLLLLLAASPPGASALDQKTKLLKLKASLDGDNWDQPWDESANPCSDWDGITCENGNVVSIDLPGKDAPGEVSPHVYTLPKLKRLNLSKNRITGLGTDKLDDVLQDGERVGPIEVIDVTSNRVNHLQGLGLHLGDTLEELHMTDNNMKRNMPPALFSLKKLRILAISENEIDGTIDTRIGKLTNLREFYCYGNKVTGTIPSEIGNLKKMQILTFAENLLTGPLPAEIQDMTNLKTFSVHNNVNRGGSHTGPLPKFDKHPYLTEVLLDGNAFTGTIPSSFLSGLDSNQTANKISIGLSENKLTGTIPAEFLEFDSLVLNVVGNDLSGLDTGIYGKMCDKGAPEIGGWMGGLVERFGCDSILCPPDYWNSKGRQETEDKPCEECGDGTDGKLGATACGADTGNDMSELEILAEFYLSLGGATDWDETEGWEAMNGMESYEDVTLPAYADLNIDPCKFKGVVCESNKVTELSLPNNGLEGLVPPSLWDLGSLRELDLSGNEVRLDRDYGFGDIGRCTSLRKVDLSSNDIQVFTGLGKATNLRHLTVDDAYFWSEIDTDIYKLTNLQTWHMQFSGLKGKIPDGLSRMTSLKAINLYGNELKGTIPTEIGLIPTLWHIDFSENDMTGTIPAGAIKKLPELAKFHIHQSGRSGDGITGKLPSFAEQTKLKLLDVSSNMMTGSIPADFLSGVTDTDELMEIDIGYNQFTGQVPDSLKRFTNMRFEAVKNRISGVAPGLCASRGWFNGEVGKVIDQGGNGCAAILCPKGTYNDYGRARSNNNGDCLDCPTNQYAGSTGCDANGDGVVDDATANLEKNILDKLFISTGGKNWTKGGDSWADGPVCGYEGVTCASGDTSANEGVTEINVAGFGLTSEIPTQIYQLPMLKKVDFSNNAVDLGFDGIASATKLEWIYIDDADLVEVSGVSDAPALTKLHIARNSFPDGTIPSELYDISTIESLAIGFNGFSGSISPDIAKLKNLKEFWAGNNDITGSVPTEFSQLPQLVELVLSGNRMSGEIPNELENIDTLKLLHLNNQRDFGGFTGPLPSFKNAQHLHNLDFSKNSLTGSIPDDFMESVRKSGSHDIYAYDSIDISSNQITGDVPADWDDFVGLFAKMDNNRITGVPGVLCDDDDEFMEGMVGQLSENKCDAILCPPGTFAELGRQASVDVPCEQCPGDTDAQRREQAPYYGSLKCKPISGERKILEQLYDKIFSGNSEDKYWGSEHPICSWYGITCDDDSADSGITEIKLESNAMSTDDPDAVSKLFFDLPLLERLNIRGNEGLTLTFDNVGKPQHLELLQLSATGLTSIDGISKATKLKELHITENNIERDFPEEILELKSMRNLYMSFNKISGSLPTRIGELTDLREFYIYTNALTGQIPSELGLLTDIEILVLGKNSFKGTLPTELNNLANLREFSVYYGGELTGPVLDFPKVTKIEKLDLEGNQFTGQLPSTFLSGLDQDFISDEDNEIILHLADNGLRGVIPDTLLDIKNLYLDIVGNQFKDLPSKFCENDLWMNGKVGDVDNPCHAIACPRDTFLDAGRVSNTDEKCTPCGSLETAPFIGSYTCSKDAVEINALKALYTGTYGDTWDKNDNWMDYSQPICSWYGIECAGDSLDNSTVTGINLPENSLGGTLPTDVYRLPSLKSLDIKGNNILVEFGDIGKAKYLETLYISDVDIGNIDGVGKAPALRELHLTANYLTGELPDDFFELADTLEKLYIAYNSFSGTLSTEFGKMTKLVDFYAYDNDFTGSIPSEFATLENLENFVVAENQLSGTIPKGFSDMQNLVLFSAYRRLKPGSKLTGPLPSFSNAPKLEGLYLDYNHLAGTIPKDFIKTSLNTKLVTISHNQLSGKVPTELALFENLNLEMEGNKITEVDDQFCASDKGSWMNGAMSEFGCDALMCKPGFISIYGRQNSTDSPCEKCDASTDPSPYWGSISCDNVFDEKEVLELLFTRTGGDDWHKKDNWLKTDNICDWYGIECQDKTSVSAIRLQANNLQGTPPEELFRLHQLHTLWLHSNPIDFKFKGIGKAQNLVELRLDSTGLTSISGIGDATSLLRLNLKYNRISGPIPSELLQLEKLESLTLTDNRLTGELPANFGPLRHNLVHLRLGSNMLTGELKGFTDFKSLLHLDLSQNGLEGSIPKTFLLSTSAHKPVEVDLSSNKLSGTVPVELNRFSELVMYLRDNQFTTLDQSSCDVQSNRGWNLGEVYLFGCNAIMCPPGTANYHGRQSAENNPCLKCPSNTNLYGQSTCNGLPLEAYSSGSRVVRGFAVVLISSITFGMLSLM